MCAREFLIYEVIWPTLHALPFPVQTTVGCKDIHMKSIGTIGFSCSHDKQTGIRWKVGREGKNDSKSLYVGKLQCYVSRKNISWQIYQDGCSHAYHVLEKRKFDDKISSLFCKSFWRHTQLYGCEKKHKKPSRS